jgi:anti-sigma28 factor (negative regulator of flagellin synthesis)
MRIDSISPKELLSQYSRVRERTEIETSASSVDKAELTSEAKTFSVAFKAAMEALETQPPEREQHLAEVAQKIADGTYCISGEDVARKIFGK